MSLLRPLAHFLLDPLVHFCLALLLGGLLWRFRSRPWGRGLAIYALLWLFLTAVSPLPVYLAYERESRHAVLWALPDSLCAPHILVLGGGHSPSPSLPPNGQLSAPALARLTEALRLKQQCPQALLIGSGYSPSSPISQAETLTAAAVALGVPTADTLQLSYPVNTQAEAYAYAARFGPDQALILVTSALHLPRALFWFRRAGLRPIPAPANHLVRPVPARSTYHFRPSTHKLDLSQALLREWAGMIVAKATAARD